MMDNELVEVTEADRAAADRWQEEHFDDGEWFSSLVQAFARHRLASQPVPASDDLVERVIPALRKAMQSRIVGDNLYLAFQRSQPINVEALELIARAIIPIVREDERAG